MLPYTCGFCGLEGVQQETRNLNDVYHHYHNECVKAALDLKRNDMVIVCESINGDFNLSSVIRSANQFAAREIWIVGRKRWDRRGSVGVQNYEHIKYAPDIEACYADLKSRQYTISAVDNIDGAVPTTAMRTYRPKTAFVFGEEQRGLSDEAITQSNYQLFIPCGGSARSLNIASAASIIMFDYSVKNVW